MNKEKLKKIKTQAHESVLSCIRSRQSKDALSPDKARELFATDGKPAGEVDQKEVALRKEVWSDKYKELNNHNSIGVVRKRDFILDPNNPNFISIFFRRGNKPLYLEGHASWTRELTHFIVKAEVKHAFVCLFKGLDLTLEDVLQINKIKSSHEEFYIFESLTLEQRLEELRERAGSRVVYFQSERRRVA